MRISMVFQVFAPTDINNPLSIKNHNEVLRCFAVLGKFRGLIKKFLTFT